jgi:hypothetical protein
MLIWIFVETALFQSQRRKATILFKELITFTTDVAIAVLVA